MASRYGKDAELFSLRSFSDGISKDFVLREMAACQEISIPVFDIWLIYANL